MMLMMMQKSQLSDTSCARNASPRFEAENGVSVCMDGYFEPTHNSDNKRLPMSTLVDGCRVSYLKMGLLIILFHLETTIISRFFSFLIVMNTF